MDRATSYRMPRLPRRWKLAMAFAALPGWGLGCTGMSPPTAVPAQAPAVARAAADDVPPARPSLPEVQLSTKPSSVAPPEQITTPPRDVSTGRPANHAGHDAPAKALPISLDTVLRLAQDQNWQVAIAREKVREAYAQKDVARGRWLPDLYAGTAWYRHEGGIQNEDGTLTHSSFSSLFPGIELHGEYDIKEIAYQQVNAQRMAIQQRGEMSRITAEQLLDAANTYIDLLTSLSAAAIARETVKNLEDLLEPARGFARVEPGSRGQVESILTEIDYRRQTIRTMTENAASASAHLAYVLGLDPCTQLVPVDLQLVPFDLVDPSAPTCDLVQQALTAGPGIRELEEMLALIQNSTQKANGPSKYLPTFEVRSFEGGFGAGPGDSLTWDNRWDLILQARWNLTGLATVGARRRVADARIQQVHLNYEDLRGKLASEVTASHETVRSKVEEFPLARGQIGHSREAYAISKSRYTEGQTEGHSATEVLIGIRTLASSQLNYVSSLRDYDKAQAQLLILMGAAGDHQAGPAPCAQVPANSQLPIRAEQGQ